MTKLLKDYDTTTSSRTYRKEYGEKIGFNPQFTIMITLTKKTHEECGRVYNKYKIEEVILTESESIIFGEKKYNRDKQVKAKKIDSTQYNKFNDESFIHGYMDALYNSVSLLM